MTFAPGRSGPSLSGFTWKRSLEADLDRLVNVEHASVLVCLMEDRELTRFEIPDLIAEATQKGLHVLRLPIVDGCVPDSTTNVAGLLDQIHAAIAHGDRVVIHCLGGMGRTGTIAGCYLREIGFRATDALAMLAKTRGPGCPEAERQEDFVSDWKRKRPKNAAK
jgi:ADP-ribosyl-[dinitrogen reductase] hydrolase